MFRSIFHRYWAGNELKSPLFYRCYFYYCYVTFDSAKYSLVLIRLKHYAFLCSDHRLLLFLKRMRPWNVYFHVRPLSNGYCAYPFSSEVGIFCLLFAGISPVHGIILLKLHSLHLLFNGIHADVFCVCSLPLSNYDLKYI